MFFWIGIVLMTVSVVFAVVCIAVFMIKKWKLKNILEQEYGKPRH